MDALQQQSKTQLIADLAQLREQVAQLEWAESERKQLEIEIEKTRASAAKSEEKFRKLYHNSPFGIAICEMLPDADGNFVDFVCLEANDSTSKKLGTEAAQFVGKQASELIPATQLKRLMQGYRRVLISKEPMYSEQYFKMFDRTLAITVFPLCDNLFIINFSDITKRKKAEAENLETQYFLEKAQEIGQIGTWKLDIVENILYWTIENYKIFGVEPGTQLNYELFLDCVHPDDREFVDQEWATGMQTNTYDIEHRLLVAGKTKWVRQKAEVTFDDAGNPVEAIGFTQDITDRITVQNELKKQRDLFETVINAIPIRIFWKDMNSVYLGSNLAFSKDAGIENPEDVIGKDDFDMVWKTDAAQYQADDQLVMRTGKPKLNYTEYSQNANHENLTWLTSKMPLKNSDGKIIGIIAASENITEKLKTEEELQSSENRFRELVNTINSGVAVYKVLNDGTSGDDYIIQDFNEFALKHENMTKSDVIGKSLKDIRPNIDQYGLIPIFRQVWQTGRPAFLPARFYGDEKFANYYENRVFRLSNGEIVAVYDDVTDRENAAIQIKTSQQRFDLAMKASRDGLYDWNLVTNEVYFSPGWKSMLGYADDELSDQFSVWEELTHPEDVQKSWAMLHELTSKKRDRFEIEFKMRHKEGHWVEILSRAEAIFDEQDVAVRVVGTHVDITERKKAAAELENYRNHLENLVEQRTQELQAKIEERQKLFDLMVGREVRMAKLKKVIQTLRTQIEDAGMTPIANDPLMSGALDELL